MGDVVLKASSDEVGLRRESTVDATGVPMWLTRLHRSLPAGASFRLQVDGELPIALPTLIEGAGFTDQGQTLTRNRTLPDYIGPGMRMLICGLNPSLHAADAGVGFVTKGNRFWPAMMEAGLVTSDRKPIDALSSDRIGFTDLAKRATSKASELTSAEFQAGISRVEKICTWLHPKAMVMVGLTGWRVATGNRSAVPGWQPELLGGVPVYLMPNTSGLNTHTSFDDLVDHFTEAAAGPTA